MANELRVRSDFVAGGLSAGMLTSDTAMSSAGLADLPAIGGTQHAVLTLFRVDVLGRVTLKETVYVTAHTASATTATVTRGREGTTAQTWLSGDRWSLSDVVSDLLVVCTSGTRPSTPYTGMHIYETDTGAALYYSGTAWRYINETRLYSKGSSAGLFLEETDAAINWALYATATKFRLNGNGTDLLTVNRTPISVNLENGALLNLNQNDLRLYSVANTDHKLKYMSTAPGGSGDGPVLFGYTKGHLATTVGGEMWQMAWESNGWITARAGVSSNAGQMRSNEYANAVGGGPTYLKGTGNSIHFDWGSPFTMWVDVTNVKNFVIDHPTDTDRHLIHACLEGPEAGVYYRGQGRLDNGWVRVDLPSYFEDLCATEGRSVQLTCMADDPEDEWCPVLHATYPRNGCFYVGLGSGAVVKDQQFWWEVKAMRKDVPPMLVEPLKTDVVVMGNGPYTYYKEK